MKIWMTQTLAMMVAAAGISIQAAGQNAAEPALRRTILVSLDDHKLALIEDGQTKKIYSVAVGKPSTPSPEGAFTIERRVANPVYRHNGRTIEPGPANPVGTRWMGLSKKGYGIHGTNEPRSIGKAASHGCIRMAKADLEELYALVAVGDRVEIIGTRNEQTARIFGAAPANAESQQFQAAKAAPSSVQNTASAEMNRQEPVQEPAQESAHESARIAVAPAASR